MKGRLYRGDELVCEVDRILFKKGETEVLDASSFEEPDATVEGLRDPDLVHMFLPMSAMPLVTLPGQELVLETEDGKRMRVLMLNCFVAGQSITAAAMVQEHLGQS